MRGFRPGGSRRRLAGHFLWFVTWLAVTVGAFIVSPSPHGHGTHQQLGLPPCPSVLFWGRPCPGCGLTTAFAATVRGDLVTAWHAHALGTAMYLIWTVTAWLCLYGFVVRQRFETSTRAWNVAMVVAVAVFFAYGAWRFATTRASLNYEPPALRAPSVP